MKKTSLNAQVHLDLMTVVLAKLYTSLVRITVFLETIQTGEFKMAFLKMENSLEDQSTTNLESGEHFVMTEHLTQ